MKPNIKSIFTTVLLLFFGFSSSAQIYITTAGSAKFVSDAPLELISATSDELQGAVNLTDNRFAFKINNKSFVGFNSPLQQEHFYENYIETDLFKSSTFEGKIIEKINPEQTGQQNIRAKGILNIHGIEQERIINATIEFLEDYILIECEYIVPLKDHNIRIPNVVNQKIAENIDVFIRAELKEKLD